MGNMVVVMLDTCDGLHKKYCITHKARCYLRGMFNFQRRSNRFYHLQICSLRKEGKDVMLVTSGAVGIGRQLLSKQQRLSLSVREIVNGQR